MDFASPGEYVFTAPNGVTSITIQAIGAPGGDCKDNGDGSGGKGAVVTATIGVTADQQLTVGVGSPGGACAQPAPGQGGIGGGGSGGEGNPGAFGGAGGGGASLVGVASPSPGFLGQLVVAGAGGGAGYEAFGANGGDAGGAGAGQGINDGQPGTATAGGAAGGADCHCADGGTSGAFGLGGTGGGGSQCAASGFISNGGGGGGAGYYGGGGGGYCQHTPDGSGGGGGSSFVVPGATGVSMALASAPPGVSITYAAPTADESTATMHFGAQAQGTAGPAQTLTVKNNGSAPLVVSGVLLGGADPDDFLVVDRCQLPVSVGASCQVGVRFHPQVSGGRSATLTLLTNAATAPAAVALAGGTSVGGKGPAGKVDLLSCKPPESRAMKRNHTLSAAIADECTEKLVRGSVKFTVTGASTRAKLVRKAIVFATGAEVATPDGGSELVLREKRQVIPGRYTLVLRHRHRGRWVTQRLRIAVRR
jgi:hypothetical protein